MKKTFLMVGHVTDVGLHNMAKAMLLAEKHNAVVIHTNSKSIEEFKNINDIFPSKTIIEVPHINYFKESKVHPKHQHNNKYRK